MTDPAPHSVADTLRDMGLTIPEAVAPVANYVPYVRHGSLLVISGQLPMQNGSLTCTGLVGLDVSVAEGYAAARVAAINIIAQIKAAVDGDWSRVEHVLRLGGFVACGGEFTDHPKVINGASDLIAEVFGPAGAHARAATGASSLPLGASVEVEALVALKDG